MGDIGCFSFYVTKNIITGEGGMVTTDNEEYAARIKTMGLHGMSADAWKRFADDGYKHYDVVSLGYKYNMMDMQAAIGLHQLDRIDMYYKKRLSIWKAYDKSFKDLPLQIPAPFDADTRHSLHLYTILLDGSDSKLNRDFFSAALHKENIGIGVHYRALHLHPFYQKTLGYKKGDFPNAEFISDRTISLPLSPGMSMRNAHDVSKAVRRIVTYFSRT
jgi:dTDP-4-amino-4,6-dideoxygalactose transaminase